MSLEDLIRWLQEKLARTQQSRLYQEGQTQIGPDDSQSRTLEQVMAQDPRYQLWLSKQYNQSRQVYNDAVNPMTPDDLNSLIMRQMNNFTKDNKSLKGML